MGIYYYFVNVTRGERNTKPLFGDSISWMANLNYYSDGEINSFFEEVITANDWNRNDVIRAYPDNGTDYIEYEGPHEDV